MSLRVTGTVQGVFYRTSAQHIAEGLGVYGFIQNNLDGSVTVEAEGTPRAVEEFIAWCKIGTARAQVTALDAEPGGLQHFTDFHVR